MYDSSYRALFSALRIIVIFAIVLLLGGYILRSCDPTRPPLLKCRSSLKQIALALKQYALDNNETFPFTEHGEPYQALGKLHPDYASSIDVFRCPCSHDRKWDEKSIHEQNNKNGALLRKDACQRSLSYAYGHNKGKPWTEKAPSSTRIAADKYATEDYSDGDNRKRPSNHADGRNFARFDGSAAWDNSRNLLEADPECDIKVGMSIDDTQYKALKDSDPEHDQTGEDWWSDPPEK
jgi:hypothetical protein